MKKKYLLFFIASLSFFASYAQQASRLIGLTKTGFSTSAAAFLLQDSAAYMYHGIEDTTNGGGLAFDSSYLFGYSDSITINNQSYRSYQTLVNNNLTTTLTQWYDTIAGTWNNYMLNNTTYNSDSNATQIIIQNWDSVGLFWQNSLNTMTTYAGANLTVKITQNWITALNTWRNSIKDSFAFDGNNNTTYFLEQSWDTVNNIWVNSSFAYYSYNSMNQVLGATRFVWNTAGPSWTNSVNDIYSYNAQNLLETTIIQRLDSVTGDWRNQAQDSIIYNGSGNIVIEYKNSWDTLNNVWKKGNMQAYTYDVNNNNLSDTFFNWNNANATYRYNNLSTYTYNSFNQVLTYTTISWNVSAQVWLENISNLQYRYYYETFTDTVSHTGVQTLTTGTLSAYPVPAQTQLNITLNWTQPQAFTIGIYDAAGNLIRQWGGDANASVYKQTIPVGDLAAGNYFIKARGSKQEIVQKFVIVR